MTPTQIVRNAVRKRFGANCSFYQDDRKEYKRFKVALPPTRVATPFERMELVLDLFAVKVKMEIDWTPKLEGGGTTYHHGQIFVVKFPKERRD